MAGNKVAPPQFNFNALKQAIYLIRMSLDMKRKGFCFTIDEVMGD
jgi:hypothetical protein